MAKAGKLTKSEKGAAITQKHIHSRISYLYQAAIYLSNTDIRAEKEAVKRRTADKAALLKAGQSEEPFSSVEGLKGHGTSIKVDGSDLKSSNPPLESQRQPEAIPRSSSLTQTHHLLASMRSISQKSQIRLSQSIKRSVCRRCNGLLMLNSTAELENLSQGGRRAWADVLVVRCSECGFVKRYPVGMGEGQNRRTKRGATPNEKVNDI